MRGMRACATANAVFLGLTAAALVPLAFAACSSGSTPPQPPPGQEGATSVTTTTVAPLPLTNAADAPKAKPAPKSTADCKVVLSEITNEPPDGAMALNNAQTAKDAGATDRLELLTALIKAKREGFRCCFDVWAKDHPGAQGTVKMALKLKPDGSVISVDFDDTPNRVPDVETCVAELARSLSYPRSPSGKETKFHYPFDFKARR
jgi:hypothetical protein